MKKLKLGLSRTVYRGKIFTVTQRPVVLPDGTKTIFEYCVRRPSVNILAFNEKKDVLLIRERRSLNNKVEWGLPAGQMDVAEKLPRAAAQRELREETGYAAGRLRLLKKSSASDKIIWDVYAFVATGLYKSPLPSDPGEDILERKFFPLKIAARMAIDGTIQNEFVAYAILRMEYLVRTSTFKW